MPMQVRVPVEEEPFGSLGDYGYVLWARWAYGVPKFVSRWELSFSPKKNFFWARVWFGTPPSILAAIFKMLRFRWNQRHSIRNWKVGIESANEKFFRRFVPSSRPLVPPGVHKNHFFDHFFEKNFFCWKMIPEVQNVEKSGFGAKKFYLASPLTSSAWPDFSTVPSSALVFPKSTQICIR